MCTKASESHYAPLRISGVSHSPSHRCRFIGPCRSAGGYRHKWPYNASASAAQQAEEKSRWDTFMK
jgi:hypothetical protein